MCYDAGFPESARTLTLKGSEIIFCPSAWRIQDQMIWKLNIFQRAFENTVFVAGVNSVTKTETLHLFGESRIISPDGILISEAKMDKEEILISQIDLSDIEKHREKIQYLKDRNPEVYRMV
jgi:predicted amidohydrolase